MKTSYLKGFAAVVVPVLLLSQASMGFTSDSHRRGGKSVVSSGSSGVGADNRGAAVVSSGEGMITSGTRNQIVQDAQPEIAAFIAQGAQGRMSAKVATALAIVVEDQEALGNSVSLEEALDLAMSK